MVSARIRDKRSLSRDRIKVLVCLLSEKGACTENEEAEIQIRSKYKIIVINNFW